MNTSSILNGKSTNAITIQMSNEIRWTNLHEREQMLKLAGTNGTDMHVYIIL